jgi:hypothetical protein
VIQREAQLGKALQHAREARHLMKVGKHAHRNAKVGGAPPQRVDARIIEHRLGLGPGHHAQPFDSSIPDPVAELVGGIGRERIDDTYRGETLRMLRGRIGDVAVVITIRAERLHQDRAIYPGAIHLLQKFLGAQVAHPGGGRRAEIARVLALIVRHDVAMTFDDHEIPTISFGR